MSSPESCCAACADQKARARRVELVAGVAGLVNLWAGATLAGALGASRRVGAAVSAGAMVWAAASPSTFPGLARVLLLPGQVVAEVVLPRALQDAPPPPPAED